jgi:geranylgeranyl pyrophosphate synthase
MTEHFRAATRWPTEGLRRGGFSRRESRMDFAAEMKRQVARVERGIDRFVPHGDTRPARLHTAMRYSLEAGGKRVRPVLVLAAAELFGVAADDDRSLPAAVALECIHTYSLIHDDLPCMDNDDLRRGRPTAHKAFDEATALLAGDALLTHAFALLAENYAGALSRELVRELADAAGSRRLIGGQVGALLAERKATAVAGDLEFIHLNKTAAMIEAALVIGARIAGAADSELANLRVAGRHLGLAFQIIDDVLDATADTATLGKTAGKDARAGKATFVKLHGVAESNRLAREHSTKALAALESPSRRAEFMTALFESMASRSK